MSNPSHDTEMNTTLARLQMRAKFGGEKVYVWMKTADGDFQRMKVLDIQGTSEHHLFVESDSGGRLWP